MKFRVVVGLVLTLVATWAFGATTWQLPSGYYVPAKMPMTVVFPRPDSETNTYARQHLAYADGATQYRIPIAIQGGAYPFHYTLSSTPAISTGMAIGQDYGQVNYGIVTWTPQASDIGKTYNVTVTVTDQEGKTAQVTWSVTATTSHFVFVDPNAPAGGDGTKAHPFNSTTPLFVEHTSTTPSPYANDIVYFRGGTTKLFGPETSKIGNVQLQNNINPMVWLGYPDDVSPAPTLDFSQSKVMIDNQNDVYIGGLDCINARTDVTDTDMFFFNQNAPQSRITFFENNFKNLQYLSTGDPNQAAITFFDPGSYRKYFALIGNTIDKSDVELVDIFSMQYAVLENNKFYSSYGTINPRTMLYLKEAILDFSVRRNSSLTSAFQYGLVEIDGFAFTHTNDNIEICYNVGISGNPNQQPALVYEWAGSAGVNANPRYYVYRNTFYGWIGGLDDFPYTVTEDNNVLIDDTSKTAKYNNSVSGGKTVISSNNLAGTSSNGYIDKNGDLVGNGGQYIGTHGHQIVTGVTPLSAPTWN